MSASDFAFLVFVAGIAAIAAELIRPGFYLPGVLGAGATAGGLFVLYAHASHPQLLAAGVFGALLLFVAGNWSPVPLLSGALATLALAGCLTGCSNAGPNLVIPVVFAAGTVLTWVLKRARCARRNKVVEAAG